MKKFAFLFIPLCLIACRLFQGAAPTPTNTARTLHPPYSLPATWTPVPTATPKPSATPRNTITPSSVPSSTKSPLPTYSPVPTAISMATLVSTSPAQYNIVNVSMIDAQNGWAVFVEEYSISGGEVYERYWLGHTNDGGVTWINVSPPSYKWEAYGRLSVSALDATTAWAYLTCPSNNCAIDPALIWHSEDGGSSWQPIAVPYPAEWVAWLEFVDDQHGWLYTMDERAMGHILIDFFRTVDGGKSWIEMPWYEPDPVCFSEYGGSDLWFDSELLFMDVNTGFWELFGYEVSLAQLRSDGFGCVGKTVDGGRSWQTLYVPMPSSLFDDLATRQFTQDSRFYCAHEIGRLDDGVVTLRFDCWEPQWTWGDLPVFSINYLSGDQGTTWHALYPTGGSAMLDGQIGWRLADTVVMTGTSTLAWEKNDDAGAPLFGGQAFPPMALLAWEKTADGGVTWLTFPQERWIVEELENQTTVLVHEWGGGKSRSEIAPVFLPEALWQGRRLRLEALWMETAQEGWGLEGGGRYVHTLDGGLTWQVETPTTPVTATFGSLPEAQLPQQSYGEWVAGDPLPAEPFPNGRLPDDLQKGMQSANQYDGVTYGTDNFSYVCENQGVNAMPTGMTGVARICTIDYLAGIDGPAEFVHYWYAYHYLLYADGNLVANWPGVVAADFVSELVGWRVLARPDGLFDLERTGDGGVTWTTIKTLTWYGDLDFVNELEGWAIARQPRQQNVPFYLEDIFREAVLLHTTDGGLTWAEVKPVLAGQGR